MKAIISILSALFLLLFATDKLQAQTALPYFSGFDNATQKNGWQIFRKGATGTYNFMYSTIVPYSGTESIYHDYPVGGTTITDDWFVSPGFNLPSGGKLDSIRHHFSGFGTPATEDTLAIYVLTGNADPALATSKVLLHDFRGAKYVNNSTWNQTTNLSIPSSTTPVYIAIRYKTVVNWLTVKFDNIRIRSNATTAIHEPGLKTNTVNIFPNPAKDVLNIRSNAPVKEIRIADINGRIVYKKAFNEKVDLSGFGNGIYLLTCITGSGEKVSQTFVKN
jgi:hypothetical protein